MRQKQFYLGLTAILACVLALAVSSKTKDDVSYSQVPRILGRVDALASEDTTGQFDLMILSVQRKDSTAISHIRSIATLSDIPLATVPVPAKELPAGGDNVRTANFPMQWDKHQAASRNQSMSLGTRPLSATLAGCLPGSMAN